MRKRRSLRLLVATVLALAAAAPVVAHVGSQPCETGREYAHDHVAHMAMAGELGLNHATGAHQGYSTRPAVCDMVTLVGDDAPGKRPRVASPWEPPRSPAKPAS
jgi:hypothetical protein